MLMGLGLLFGGTVCRASAAEGMRFILDFLPYVKRAPFYIGVDKGIYKQFGLDVIVLTAKRSGLTNSPKRTHLHTRERDHAIPPG
jgi:ABC-type nitrate/sulfonate/bicarbonate transport system substrate-binding protein